MWSCMIGSRRWMLAVEKNVFTALRRRRCMSWSIVATIELGAVKTGQTSVDIQIGTQWHTNFLSFSQLP